MHTHQVGQVGYFGHGVAGSELEGDAGEDEDEGQLDPVLGQRAADSEGHQGQGADHRLRRRRRRRRRRRTTRHRYSCSIGKAFVRREENTTS